MTLEADIRKLKQRLSDRLLGIQGVSGIGIPGGRLTVYLAEDSEAVRQGVADLFQAEAPGTPVSYVVTGAFRRQ